MPEPPLPARLACWPRRPPGGRPLIVAHRGGAAEAPENTLAALAAAARAGADAVEIDVCAARCGTLVVTHDDALAAAHDAAALRAARQALPLLDDALAWLAAEAPGLAIHADLKSPGAEAALAAALRRHGLTRRAQVSATVPAMLRAVADADPQLARAYGYPRDSHGASSHAFMGPAVTAALAVLRLALPARAAGLARSGRASVLAVERRVVSPALVRRCHALGLAVHVWTVDDPAEAAALARLGVDALVTDGPSALAATLPL